MSVDAGLVVCQVALLLEAVCYEVKDTFLTWFALSMHMSKTILAAEALGKHCLLELADRACKSRVPNEKECALFDTRVLINLRNNLREVV